MLVRGCSNMHFTWLMWTTLERQKLTVKTWSIHFEERKTSWNSILTFERRDEQKLVLLLCLFHIDYMFLQQQKLFMSSFYTRHIHPSTHFHILVAKITMQDSLTHPGAETINTYSQNDDTAWRQLFWPRILPHAHMNHVKFINVNLG